MQYAGVSTASIFIDDKSASTISDQLLRSPYVLVVDDDEAIVSVLLLLLEGEGLSGIGITDSRNVFPFLSQLETDQFPSVILLDLMMPVLSGYEIASKLSQSERYRHLPIIIMTADGRVRSASSVQGAIDYVAKPFQIDALMTKLKSHLDRSTS
ncbi:MAG: response regulator [Chloroflexi bacterium]|nr:MAG: response regulator [Chloroflexota bacterium]